MRRLALAIATVLTGCFGEDPSSASTTSGCDPGTDLCECYGNGTCNDGLVCIAEANLCIPEDCTPGQTGCTCVDGECLGGAPCESGVCREPATTSETGATTTTSAETTTMSTGGSAASDPTASDTNGSELCGVCFDEAVAGGGGDCSMPAAGCTADPACDGWLDCVSACMHDDPTQACLEGCCTNVPPIASALTSCLNLACGNDGNGTNDFCPLFACG